VKKGGDVDPVDRRLHGLGGAVFYPGLHDDAGKLRDAHAPEMVLGMDGGTQIHIKDGMVALGEETPVQKALLGTAFRASHTTLINALRTTFTGQATGWAALTTVFTALANDPAHSAVKAALVTAATACTAAAGMATSGAAACSSFESAAAANQDFQSNTVRLER
jgi:hypothetical protein